MKSNYSGITRIIKAFGYSYDGLCATVKSEAAFRQDLFFCLVAVLALWWIPVQGVALAFLIFSLFLILIMELVNTAIEVVVDRIGPDYHPLSKKAKDIGSLLVLLAFIHFFIVWAIIVLPLIF